MIDLFDPLSLWEERFPDGFEGKRDIKLPVLGRKLMLGANVRLSDDQRVPADIEVNFQSRRLSVAVESEEDFDGLVVANFKLEVPEYDSLRASIGDTQTIEVGRSARFAPIPQGERQTAFGTINEMVAFALGHTSLECFR